MSARWTPAAVILAIVAAVLAGAGVVSVVAHEDDSRAVSGTLDAAVAGTTTTTTEAATTTTSAPPGTTTSTTQTPTTVGRTTTTRRATTTTLRPTTTTTTAGPAATATTNPPATAVLCSPDQIDISVAADPLKAAAGTPITLRTTIRNRSTDPCFYRGYNVTMTFLDPKGNTIIGQAAHADDIQFRPFAPAQAISHSATWDPNACPTPPCAKPAADIYSVTADWSFSGGRYGATQQFVLS